MPAEKQETIRAACMTVIRGVQRKARFGGDDDMRNAFALSRLLNGRDLRVTIARSGAKALETLGEHP